MSPIALLLFRISVIFLINIGTILWILYFIEYNNSIEAVFDLFRMPQEERQSDRDRDQARHGKDRDQRQRH